jgi:phosphoribosylformylglycinamidine synthase
MAEATAVVIRVGRAKPKVLILTAAGINRDLDAENAWLEAGASPEKVHINDLIMGIKSLKQYQMLMIPGGFSFGDDIASGKVLANKLKYKLRMAIREFIDEGKLILGVCNGFQIMVKFGLLPAFDRNYEDQKVTLTYNDSGKFEDRWVYLKVNQETPCVFTKGVDYLLYLPVCHGEGKFVPADTSVLQRLKQNNHIVLQYVDKNGNFGGYPVNPNGSVEHIAGICDETGRLFGLMPHPEDYIYRIQHPRWTREKLPSEGLGLSLFKNAVNYMIKEYC